MGAIKGEGEMDVIVGRLVDVGKVGCSYLSVGLGTGGRCFLLAGSRWCLRGNAE